MEENDILKYKDYPEGSGGKRLYDSQFLPFQKYLTKYYTNPDLKAWNRWLSKYIEPAFDEKRHQELVENFGYIIIENHDFKAQDDIFQKIRNDGRLDEETKKFIGFLSGAGFFKKWNLTIEQWFNMPNWSHPHLTNSKNKSINDLLTYQYGLNYFKANLLQMPFWIR